MAGDDLSEGDARARIYECFSRTLGIHNAVAAESVTVAGCRGGGGRGGSRGRAGPTSLPMKATGGPARLEGHRRRRRQALPRGAAHSPQPIARRYRQQILPIPAASRSQSPPLPSLLPAQLGIRVICMARSGSAARRRAAPPPVLVWCCIRAVSDVSRSRISVPGRSVDLSCAHSEHSDYLEMWELGTTRQ